MSHISHQIAQRTHMSHANANKMIVCTSTSCIDYFPNLPSNITTLPINVHIGEQIYADGIDLSVNELAEYIIHHPKDKIKTSAPDAGQILEFFHDLVTERGINEVMVFTLSTHLSQTYEHIRAIQGIFGDKLKIHLFDTRTIQQGEAFLALEASRLLNEGYGFDEMPAILNKMRDNMHLYITVDNLNTMIKTGRVSAPAGWFANLLDIKPIVFLHGSGQVIGYEKVRGFDNSLHRLVELVHEASIGKKGRFYSASYAHNPYLPTFKSIIQNFGLQNVPHGPLASASIANIGVYAIGMMFVEDI